MAHKVSSPAFFLKPIVIGMAYFLLGSFLFLAMSCASAPRERWLNSEEQERLGLTAPIYDSRVCPTVYDPASKQLRVSGDCENVTCEQDKQEKLRCRAVPEARKKK